MNHNGSVKNEKQELAALYALGALSQHEARAFEALLSEGDPDSQNDLRSFESVAAALALDAPEAAPPAEAKNRLFARLAQENNSAQSAASPALNQALKEIFHVRADEGKWRQFSEGVEAKILFNDKARGSVSTLLKLQPGAEIVRHRHVGIEECLVLQGDFHIGDEEYSPGDYQCALPGSIHERVFSKNGALVLIISGGYELLA
jgi:anti-sigma factor ChrR (cupin superfamily)